MIRNLSKKTFIQKIFDKKAAKTQLLTIAMYFIGIDNAITKKFNISATCYLYKYTQKTRSFVTRYDITALLSIFQPPGNLYTCSYSKMIFYFVNCIK